MKIITPESPEDFLKYFQLRWEILRKPWNQPIGSERDNYENSAHHLMAIINNSIAGVGRIHFENDFGIIRYMATHPEFKSRGVGSALLREMEIISINNGIFKLKLNARESAVPFYQKNGFHIIKKSHILFGEIQHFMMKKNL